MSNVLRKNRRETKLQVIIDGLNLRTALTKVILSGKIKEEAKILLANSIFNCVDKLVDRLDIITLATSDELNLGIKPRRYAIESYIYTQQLHGKLVNLIEATSPTLIKKLAPSVDLILKIRDFLERRYNLLKDEKISDE